MANIHLQSATTVFLDQPPSCLEFCPDFPDHFVVGTYLLSENKVDEQVEQTKTGSLQLWKLNPNTNELLLIQRVALPYAVFDLHFHPGDRSKFAIAGSTGCIALFNVSSNSTDSSTEPSINQIWTKQVHEDSSIPALFLAWAPQDWLPGKITNGFAVTFSDSLTAVFGSEGEITEESQINELGSFQARQMIEVWFVALASMKETTSQEITPFMFTGNDFGSLHTRRFGTSTDENDSKHVLGPLLLDYDDRARHHTAGVTSILPLPVPMVDDAPILLTGSYDEGLRVYHATRRGEVLAEQALGGGVWRLQLLDTKGLEEAKQSFLVLASCMHAGTRVVRVNRTPGRSQEWDIEVLAEFTEHESMNYASGVWEGSGSETSSELLCVSSSFYDRRVCVWRATV
ncbi:hypothetical protein N7495_009779 [Penicillium taxi]|uniref:uncharacterized protein n=1 Tax=Penicillium taxi TaxID=168475 RepID=UPI00254518D7|nr:uncharacterized protein N7495_009779 [Penicillium taxi]KAJ5885269.1 hypothetical protein N7495_009779 [Penicillium taxi]